MQIRPQCVTRGKDPAGGDEHFEVRSSKDLAAAQRFDRNSGEAVHLPMWRAPVTQQFRSDGSIGTILLSQRALILCGLRRLGLGERVVDIVDRHLELELATAVSKPIQINI